MNPVIGDKFGKLTVTGDPISRNGRYWPCKCECGGEALVSISDLRKREATNGGCSKCYRVKHGRGKSTDPTYSKYQAMRQRCENEKHRSFANYGGRGIKVCERWMSFENFLADMGDCPSDKHSIERRDSDGGYEPNNCEWATVEAQANNRRNNVKVEVNGLKFSSLKKAAEHFGIDYGVVRQRIARGNSVELSLKAPIVEGFKGKGLSNE